MKRYFKVQIVLFFRLILGIIFVYASWDKIAHPIEFAKAIENYHVVPFGLENMIAMVLPWLELIVGICLIMGCAGGMPFAVVGRYWATSHLVPSS